ncbi:MAG: hypothetical protein ACJAYU_001659 [Bradymonadia bacterium]|jgi:hypothetical protein
MKLSKALLLSLLVAGASACGDEETSATDPGATDAGATDAGATDAGATDAGATDAGATDAGATDAGATDAGATDAGATDAGATDAGATDAGATDAGATDAGATDAGETDADTGLTDVSADAVVDDTGTVDVEPDAFESLGWDELFAELNINGCSGSYCHGGGAGGLSFTDADSAYSALIGSRIQGSAAACGASERIVPGDADASGMYIRLRPASADSPDCTPEKMPPGSPGLDAELAEALAAWINAGANR